MGESYAEAAKAASGMLSAALLARSEDCRNVDTLEAALQPMIREVARRTEQVVLEARASQLVEAELAQGRQLERRPRVKFEGLFGVMEIESPYFSHGQTETGARPVQDMLGVVARGRSERLQRALTDFGAEESFGNAAKRFEEHYGWAVGRTSVLRLVESVARETEKFVEEKLQAARKEFDKPLAERPGVERVLVEMDGGEIRTGKLVAAPELGKTEVLGLDKRRRETAWRDVRMGMARPLDQVEPTYVGKLAGYPEVVGQIFEAACLRGLSSTTQVIACTDGGNGIREEIEAQFTNLQYVLDRPHLKSHLYETADAMGLKDTEREQWVSHQMARFHKGDVQLVLDELAGHKGRGKARASRLHDYIMRFQDAVHYDAFEEAGIPQGSGEIESAHRAIPQKRLKLPGTWWNVLTVNPMLALRVLRANGWWHEFWEARAAA